MNTWKEIIEIKKENTDYFEYTKIEKRDK